MKVLITGGAGFIGSNAAKFYLESGAQVTILDNFSRVGSASNLAWLKSGRTKPTVIKADVTDSQSIDKLRNIFKSADLILHLAAQVAVTTSVSDPRKDFEINILGTLNVLEAMRLSKSKAKLIYASTNKVYGNMENLTLHKSKSRYEYRNLPYGIDENYPLDFHSPYGCSKGSADQYVHDYSRIYGLDTVVFRQSCIYGPRQFGVEDQGWVAWFMIAAILDKPITIYGDGFQVRDLLNVSDLVNAYDLVYRHRNQTRGQIYNIGGGKENTLSVWKEFKPKLEELYNRKFTVKYEESRLGDQKIYISDIRKAGIEFKWYPKINIETGFKQLYDWINRNEKLFQ